MEPCDCWYSPFGHERDCHNRRSTGRWVTKFSLNGYPYRSYECDDPGGYRIGPYPPPRPGELVGVMDYAAVLD
jgi:hypothetical protein